VKFNVPSKTFLLGEYVALHGGPALLLAHGPHFECTLGDGETEVPFHPDSPAGEWVELHEDLFKSTQITFLDPHEGVGGFGASTAQFMATYLYALSLRNMYSEGRELSALEKWAIIEDYKNLFEGDKTIPSGYDLMAQMGHGLQIIDAGKNRADHIQWPFTDIEIHIYKTQKKITTHEHLKKIHMSSDTVSVLERCASSCVAALNMNSKDLFFKDLREFSHQQEKAKLLSPDSAQWINKALSVKGVVAARGCGALGADVLALFVEKGSAIDKSLVQNLAPVWNSNMEPI
jgi:mevalonate kinase